mgnify:CR=1 FL=1
MKYKIYFNFYGKKQATIEAKSKKEAESILRNKLTIDNIEAENIFKDDKHVSDFLKGMFGFK